MHNNNKGTNVIDFRGSQGVGAEKRERELEMMQRQNPCIEFSKDHKTGLQMSSVLDIRGKKIHTVM